MSKFDSEEMNMPGYFLPEDSQFRLKKLRDHMTFLSRLAQPRTWDEVQECAPEVRVDELAICLELLAEQVATVLEEASWPAQRAAEKSEGDVAPAEAPAVYGAAAERFAFGVTLDQIDALNRLIQTLAAHGDVVAGSHAAELADRTLPRLGQAIHDGAEAVRAILDAVEAQPLGQGFGPRNRVGETRAVYGAAFASPDADGILPGSCPYPNIGQGRNRSPASTMVRTGMLQ